jgi:GT2 family glycosyltransferase
VTTAIEARRQSAVREPVIHEVAAEAAPAPEGSTPTVARDNWPLVSVVVVNYNGRQHLARCLEALLSHSYPAQQLLIVDNASTDGSRALLEEVEGHHPDVTVLWSDRNLGYAGGVNLALRSARGAYVAVLNVDVQVEHNWLAPIIAFLEQHPDAGAANPLILLSDGKHVNAAGQDVHVTGLGFNRWLGRPVAAVGSAPMRVSGIQGGAFVVRRDLLERVGGMDASGLLYHEDVNLSWLLQLMGYALYCVPSSIVRHDYFLSMFPAKLHLLERKRWAMHLAYLRWPSLALLAPALLVTEGLMWAYCVLRGRSFLQAKLSSYGRALGEWRRIQERRRVAESVRRISDWDMVRRLKWTYAWEQFLVLARERGDSRRVSVSEHFWRRRC